MKSISKTLRTVILYISVLLIFIVIMESCKVSEAVANKSGAQLWAENCTRCHNAPSPAIYSDAQWEVVGDHMQYKANLTGQEVRKIVAFLKSAN